MTKTEHYQLNQWEATDKLSRADFNADNAVIDAALANKAEKSAVTAVETALTQKADASALNAYKTSNDAAVARKADASALAALQNSLSSTNSFVSALSAALGSGGSNCRIATGSYVGTGTYGSGNPNTLTFPFQPLAVWIGMGSGSVGNSSPYFSSLFLLYPIPATQDSGNTDFNVTWLSNGVQWALYDSNGNDGKQFNSSGTTYYWVAIGV